MSESKLPMPLTFETLVDSASDAVVVHDLEDRLLYWNQAAQVLYGWSFEEVHARPASHIFYLDKADREEAVETLSAQGHWAGELRQLNRGGDAFFVHSRQQLVRDASGEPVAIVCFNTDVTAQKQQRDAEERAHHVRSSSLLAGGVAHELNNALAPIMLSAAMLQRSLDDEKSLNMVAMIEKCANKGAALVAELLSFERGKRGGNHAICQAQVERTLQRVAGRVVPSSVRFEVDVAEDLWECRGELSDIAELFEHVMRNACEAMPEGGTLKVSVRNRLVDAQFEVLAPETKAGAYVAFIVKDQGQGIDQGLLARVAEPFFTTKTPKQGHGFGLSSAQAIIKGHQGVMVIESERGQGTTVSCLLPAKHSAQELSGAVPPFVVSQEGIGKRVLVADDEFFIRETIKKTLEARGYEVVVAADGTEALALYVSRINEIDLVVTNVEMPFMDGPALCRALLKLNPDAKILLSSGHQQKEKIRAIKACGVEHFLPKPYTADQLAACVRAILTA